MTISIPKALRAQVDRVSKAEGVSRSDLVRASIRDYLFIRQFRGMRKTMLAEAARRGIHTDQDVFDRVSCRAERGGREGCYPAAQERT